MMGVGQINKALRGGRTLTAGTPLAFVLLAASIASADEFLPIADMQQARAYFAIVPFLDGALAIGGENDSGPLASTERWIPDAAGKGRWATSGSLQVRRVNHTATLLSDGRILVSGGGGPRRNAQFAEIGTRVPSTQKIMWSWTGRMAAHRRMHTATLLRDGRVLVVGGYGPQRGALATAELWNPKTNTWHATGRLREARAWHAATQLADGRVLVIGGERETTVDGERDTKYLASGELWDPATGAWVPLDHDLPNGEERVWPTATLLWDGRVLVAGGWADGYPQANAFLWNPKSGNWEPAGEGGLPHGTATRLQDGRVLFVGGVRGCGGLECRGPMAAVDDATIWSSDGGEWKRTASLREPRSGHSAVLLPDGRVLIAGGSLPELRQEPSLRSAEVWRSGSPSVPAAKP